ncbi:hypothetical protein [Chryseobacterium sp. 18068]|uniref:hypothetical protein n=1 Tax=Chryseobacterium sp. 18068 TaxID=2681414 RepID=UPI0013582B92|nr:hypothetical protein [Chryseobacterium sp. 18068]
MKDKKRRSTVSMDVAAKLQEVSNIKGQIKRQRTNLRIYIQDFEKFQNLKKYLSINNINYNFKIADVFEEGLASLGKKLKFPDVPDDDVLNTFEGRRSGTHPLKHLSYEEQLKLATKTTTVELTPETLKLYNNYKTFKVKDNPEISIPELFKELINSVEKNYYKT